MIWGFALGLEGSEWQSDRRHPNTFFHFFISYRLGSSTPQLYDFVSLGTYHTSIHFYDTELLCRCYYNQGVWVCLSQKFVSVHRQYSQRAFNHILTGRQALLPLTIVMAWLERSFWLRPLPPFETHHTAVSMDTKSAQAIIAETMAKVLPFLSDIWFKWKTRET